LDGPVETQQQVADKLGGISRTRIGQIEEGLIANLSVDRGLTDIMDI
jgi:transcriptional regulator with XRE-family HTH domain